MKPLKVGLIGFGYWGKNILRNIKESVYVEDIKVAEADSSKAKKLALYDKSIDVTTEASSIFSDDTVDAIFIATPSASHYELAKEALEKGKHVFVEKPLVTRESHALELIKISQEKNLTLSVDHTFLYNDAVAKIKSLINEKQVGDINYIDLTRINLGIYQQDVNVMWDLAAHDISIINYLTDKKPTHIRAVGRVNEKFDMLDLAYIFMHYDTGLLAQINCSWASPVKIRKMLIGGTDKMIIYDDVEPTDKLKVYDYINVESASENRQRVLVDYRLGDVSIPKFSLEEPLKVAIEDFFMSIIKKTKPRSNAHTGLEVVRILEKADISLRNNGQLIALD